jgi:hypothetical protein
MKRRRGVLASQELADANQYLRFLRGLQGLIALNPRSADGRHYGDLEHHRS